MNKNVELLAKYNKLVMSVIYDAERMKKFLRMMETPDGAVLAVKTVLGAIEQAKPIPPELARSLAFNTYMLMVAWAEEITDKKASPEIMQKVAGKILSAVDLTHNAAPPKQPPQQGGILQGAM